MADYVLKDAFDAAFVQALSGAAKELEPTFDQERWHQLAMPAHWPDMSLKQRMRHLSQLLGSCLPGDYARQLPVVVALATQFRSLAGMLFPDFVEVHGTAEPDLSIPALAELTSSFSAEFAVRPFLQLYPERMLQQHLAWADYPNEHVRRLASEGLRPRLPWGQDVGWLKKDPTVTLPVLEKLKNDPSEYVRRSVANHLNDISKSHPDWLLAVAASWKGQSTATDALLKHALRGLLKKGRAEAHQLFGFEAPNFALHHWGIHPNQLVLGQKATLSLAIEHRGSESSQYRVEYRIHFVKSNGQRSPKVFQIAEKSLAPGEKMELSRSHAFADLTTRKHYPGPHLLELQVNGQVAASCEFVLQEAAMR